MAKKRNSKTHAELVVPFVNDPPKYYVYYDNKTGQIISVTNEKSDSYEYGLEFDFSKVENFLTGKWKFYDYMVGYKRTIDNTTILDILPKIDDEYSFRNNIFEWIQRTDNECDLTVECNLITKSWTFKTKSGITDQYNNLVTPRLVFFVMLEDDFDFLIRTMYVEMEDILSTDVEIPFESEIESKIDKISISSKLVFNSYGLKVIYE